MNRQPSGDPPPFALTLVAAPGSGVLDDRALVGRAAAAAAAADPVVLAPGEAIDLPCRLPPDPVAVRAALGDAPVDVLSSRTAGRRKSLLLADMDGTILRNETLDDLAAIAGAGDAVSAITRLSMDGLIDFADALRARVALLQGLPLAALDAVWRAVDPRPGARAMVATMRAHGATCVLVSGGFTAFTERAAARFGFDAHHANTLLDDGERLIGRVAEPILDRDAKRDALRRLATSGGLGFDRTLAIGDGANDLGMLAEAGLAIGAWPKTPVAAAIPNRIEHADLRAVLYAQGFRADEIVDDRDDGADPGSGAGQGALQSSGGTLSSAVA